MNSIDERRRTGRKHLFIAAVVLLVTITQYAGLKDAARDFDHGFRNGVSEH